MAFSRVKVSGWAFGEILTAAQMNSLDVDHANAIDGAAGGSYTLSNPLTIGGNTVTINTLAVSGNMAVAGDVAVNGNVVLGDDPLLDTLTVAAIASFALSISVGTSATVGGSLFANGPAVFAGDVTVESVVQFSGNGRILGQFTELPDSNTSVDITTTQELIVTATASRQITITGATAGNDDWFIIYNGSAFTQNLVGLVTANVLTKTGVKYARVSGTWRVANAWTVP